MALRPHLSQRRQVGGQRPGLPVVIGTAIHGLSRRFRQLPQIVKEVAERGEPRGRWATRCSAAKEATLPRKVAMAAVIRSTASSAGSSNCESAASLSFLAWQGGA